MSFFERQPPLFDTKKRIGNVQGNNAAVAAAAAAANERTPPTQQAQQQQPIADDLDSQNGNAESWVELAPSRTSLCSSVEAVMIDRDNGGESSGQLRDSRLSPASMQSPHVEFEPNLDQVKYQLVKDMFPPGKNTDWIWDWSSRPEQLPPNRFMLRNRNGQIGSALTTPPNSPEPEVNSEFEYKTGGSKAKRWIFYRFEVLMGLVVSNLITFVVGATVGFCICKKLSKHHHDAY